MWIGSQGILNQTVMVLYPSDGAIDPATLVWSNQPSVPNLSPNLSYLKTDLGYWERDEEFLPAGASTAFSTELAKRFTKYNTGAMVNIGPYHYNSAN